MSAPQALFDFDAHPGFQMQSWSSTERSWTPMEEGVAPKVWAPRPAATAAVHKCLEWTGLVSIPAMRVVDLGDGSVVWADTQRYPDAGAPVMPVWASVVYDQVRAESRAAMAAEAAS